MEDVWTVRTQIPVNIPLENVEDACTRLREVLDARRHQTKLQSARQIKRVLEVRHRYVSDGRDWTLAAQLVKETPNFITLHAKRDDERTLVEMKLFKSRRHSSGVVWGSERIRMTMHSGLAGAEKDAAQAWIEAAQEAYGTRSDLTVLQTLRQQHLRGMKRLATPVRGARSTYFFYADEAEMIHAVGDAVQSAHPSIVVDYSPVSDSDAQTYDLLALSADEHLSKLVIPLETQAHRLIAGRIDRDGLWVTMGHARTMRDRHVRRLQRELPETTAVISRLEQLHRAVSKLPTANTR